jgi:hypothetical protein
VKKANEKLKHSSIGCSLSGIWSQLWLLSYGLQPMLSADRLHSGPVQSAIMRLTVDLRSLVPGPQFLAYTAIMIYRYTAIPLYRYNDIPLYREKDPHIQAEHGELLREPVSVCGLQGSLYVRSQLAELFTQFVLQCLRGLGGDEAVLVVGEGGL